MDDARAPRWHALPAADVAARLDVDPARGLASAEVDRRRALHGPNALPEPASRSRLAIVVGQVKSPLVALLVVAAGLSFAMGDVVDACVIVAVVALNTLVGAYQEGRAERSLAALRRLVVMQVRVRREARDHVIDARHLVPGDVVVLAAGDKVAADARLVEAEGLRTAEAALTGESAPVDKDVAPAAEATDLAERRGIVYAGTHVTAGRGLAVVVATGTATELGRIATLTAAAVEPPTPLARRIDGFGRLLLVIAGVLLVVVVAAGLARGLDPRRIFLVGISQVVSLVPEGLPVALTIALAVGVRRMSERGAIVRRLSAVETLGSVSVICTDKTGTLTRNQMSVTEVHPAREARVEVEGRGYAPVGRLLRDGAPPPLDGGLRALVETLALCNDASLAPRDDAEGGFDPVGDPTEAALVTLAGKAGLDVAALRRDRPRRGEVPFDASTRLMAVHCDGPSGPAVHVKGAPDAVLALCGAVHGPGGPAALDDDARRAVVATADGMAARALRVLAGAVVEAGDLDGGLAGLAGRATFLGLVGQTDPPRDGVAAAVAECRAASVRAVVVTGDQRATGVAVAREIGLARDGDLARTGGDLDRAAVETLAAEAGAVTVYARVRPEQKLRIVEALQARGEVVAMTGDGVNDAPALARADVGVAMGRSGTEAAREASKVVLTDDDFATIVAAVREGRIVGRNLRKAILLQVSTSIAEVLVLLGAIFLGMPLPFTAAMILWNNVVTETVITVNLVLEPGEGDEMRTPPPPLAEPLMGREALWRAVLMSLTIAGSVLGFYAWHLESGLPLAVTQTAAFTVLAVCEWFNVLNVRSARHSALDRSLLRNPWLVGGLVLANLLQAAVVFLPPLQAVFRTTALPLVEVFAIGATGSLVLWAEEVRKWAVRPQDPTVNDRPARAHLDALTPPEMAERAEAVGVAKAGLPAATTFALAVLAGAFIALGGMFSTAVAAGGPGAWPWGVHRLFVGTAFSLGLVLVVVGGAELFTGNVLLVMAWRSGRLRAGRVLRNWAIVFAGNAVGALGTAALATVAEFHAFGGGQVGAATFAAADAKCALGFPRALALGVLCNALVCLAVWMNLSARTSADRVLVTIPPVAAFVACGFEHSVANLYAVPVALLERWVWGLDVEAPHLGWRAFLVDNLLPVTLGNVIGGGVLVAVVYQFVYLRRR